MHNSNLIITQFFAALFVKEALFTDIELKVRKDNNRQRALCNQVIQEHYVINVYK